MSFGNIDSLFEKFKNLSLPDETLRRLCSKIIVQECGIEIPIESIRVKKGTVHISANPMQRNEIYMHREGILRELRDVCTNKTLKDVR